MDPDKAKINAFLSQTVFQNLTHGVLVECGANNGLANSIGFHFEKELKWKCINIEPNPHTFKELQSNRPDSININRGLHHTDDLCLELVVPTNNTENASFCLSQSHIQELIKQNIRTYSKVQTSTISWDTIGKQCHHPKLNLLVLDVEGLENTVLPNIVQSNWLPEYVFVETDWSDIGIMCDVMSQKYQLVAKLPHDYLFRVK